MFVVCGVLGRLLFPFVRADGSIRWEKSMTTTHCGDLISRAAVLSGFDDTKVTLYSLRKTYWDVMCEQGRQLEAKRGMGHADRADTGEGCVSVCCGCCVCLACALVHPTRRLRALCTAAFVGTMPQICDGPTAARFVEAMLCERC